MSRDTVVQHRPAIDTPVGVSRLGRLLNLPKLGPFLAVLHVGDMRADQLSDFAALVLGRIVEIDKHEFSHVDGMQRVRGWMAICRPGGR